MIPHTTETLKLLTWSELRTLHSSLKLKAVGKRADYEARILELQPIAIADIAAPTSFTCVQCPFARLIEGNKYCCEVSQTASDVRFGHWEATVSCFESLAEVEAGPIAELDEVVEAETPIAPQEVVATQAKIQPTIGQTPHPYIEEGIIHAMIKQTPFQKRMTDLEYLSQLEMEAQLAIEATAPNSEEEASAYQRLRKIEYDIEFHDQLAPELATPEYAQTQNQMDEPKSRGILSLFKIEPFDPSVLPTDEPEQLSADKIEPEGTIHWDSPLNGMITGKEGGRKFYIRNDEVFIMFPGDYTAGESKKPNIRHRQIRSAIDSGRSFNPRAFKLSPSFERDTEACNGGRIRQECDGRWWAWSPTGVTGHPFFSRELACKYLNLAADRRKQAQKQLACAN